MALTMMTMMIKKRQPCTSILRDTNKLIQNKQECHHQFIHSNSLPAIRTKLSTKTIIADTNATTSAQRRISQLTTSSSGSYHPPSKIMKRCYFSNNTKSVRHQFPMIVGSFFISTYYGSSLWNMTQCDYNMLSPPLTEHQKNEQEKQLTNNNDIIPVQTDPNIKSKLARYWRMFKRIVKLTVTLSPILMMYPFYLLSKYRKKKQIKNMDTSTTTNNDTVNHSMLSWMKISDDDNNNNNELNDWYYKLCLYCVECSGACVIKLMQWASSRPDLFGNDFCNIFNKLQDHTIPHSWNHTEKLLIKYSGKNYHEFIQIPNQQKSIIGSGCIGQVYHGKVLIPSSTSSSSKEEMIWQDVAIKVLHPTVEDDIQADLDILRSLVSYIDIYPFIYITELQKLKWLNLYGIVNELSRLLQLQMDLRNESLNLLKKF